MYCHCPQCWLLKISYCKSEYLKSCLADILQDFIINKRHANFFTAFYIFHCITFMHLNSFNITYGF